MNKTLSIALAALALAPIAGFSSDRGGDLLGGGGHPLASGLDQLVKSAKPVKGVR